MMSRREPPTRMLTTPWSQPAMTRPAPSTNEKLCCESNCVPFESGLAGSYSQPVYATVTVRPCVAAAPLPTVRSVAEYGADGGVGEEGEDDSPPPPHAATAAMMNTTRTTNWTRFTNIRTTTWYGLQ